MEKSKIKYQGISTLEVLTEAKNYNDWIAYEINKYISSPTLEIGAGTGNLSQFFLSEEKLYITEIDEGLVKYLQEKFKDRRQLFIRKLDITKAPPKKFINFFSTIFSVNVLEHIEDDVKALRNILKMLKVGGKIVLLVPAKKFAYTKLDKKLGHYRRYEKDEIIHKLNQSGYQIEKIYFFNILGLLSWTVRDKLTRTNIELKPYQIKIFDLMVPALRKIESVFSVPLGISLIVVARKL